MISDDYKDQLKEVHANRNPQKLWGTTGARNFGDEICKFLEHRRGVITTVLDFGAAQRKLEKYVMETAFQIDVKWTNYDPGIPGIDTLPTEKFDLIVSSDVMEHVEPDKVAETIQWQKDHANKALYHYIACEECGLILPDGRNAHLTVQPPKWWYEQYEDNVWQIQYSADCMQRRRSRLVNHCLVQLDKLGS
jgi:hypothetical protein